MKAKVKRPYYDFQESRTLYDGDVVEMTEERLEEVRSKLSEAGYADDELPKAAPARRTRKAGK